MESLVGIMKQINHDPDKEATTTVLTITLEKVKLPEAKERTSSIMRLEKFKWTKKHSNTTSKLRPRRWMTLIKKSRTGYKVKQS